MLAEKPPVARLRAVLAELSGFIAVKGSAKQRRMLMIIRRIANDVCEELSDSDEEQLSAYFAQMGQVISWIGTGTYDGMSDKMREWIEPRAEAVQAMILNGKPSDDEFEELVATQVGVDTGDASANPDTG